MTATSGLQILPPSHASVDNNWLTRLVICTAAILLCGDVSAQSNAPATTERMYENGMELYSDGDYKQALQIFLEGIALSKGTQISKERTYKLYQKAANTYGKLRYQRQAIAYLDTALAIGISHYGEKHDAVVGVYMDRSVIYSQMLNMNASTAENVKALAIARSLHGPVSERVGTIFMHMAIDYYKMDEFEASEACYLKAKEIFDKVLDPDDENHNRIYNNMGILYRKKKDYRKALDYAMTALEYKLKHYPPQHPSVGKYYSNIARVYFDLDQPEKAIPYNQKLLEVMKASYGEAHPEYGAAIGELARIYFALGDTKKAITLYEQSYEIIAGRLGPSHPYALAALTNLSMCLQSEGDINGAIRLINQAISTMQSNDEAYFPHLFDNAIRLAALYKRMGNYERARHIADSLLQVLHQRGMRPNALGFSSEYRYLRSIALKERADASFVQADGKDIALLQTAWQDLVEVVDAIDVMRRDLTSDDSQEFLFAETADLYDASVTTAMQIYQLSGENQYLHAALNVTEKSKASILRRTFMERDAITFGGLPDDLSSSLNAIEEEIYDLKTRIRAASDTEEDAMYQWTRQVVRLEDKKLQWMRQMESEYPQYYDLRFNDAVIDIDAVQDHLSEINRAFVSYYLVGEQGFIFYVTRKQCTTFSFTWKPEYEQWISNLREHHVVTSARQFDTQTSQRLYQVLWKDVAFCLQADQIQQVTISPHHALSYLPFDLLMRSDTPGKPKWLLEEYTISYAHSLNDYLSNTQSSVPALSYAGFAPFDDSQSPATSTYFAMRDALTPLPASTSEILRGSQLFNGEAFVRERATYANFDSVAKHTGILHLATHAFLMPESPLESCLYFYPDEESNEITAHRRLTMFDIYHATIPAHLVILSACQTGDGELSAGEGPLSLARAFRYAGSHSVVMSQWRANDASTAEIVSGFLEYVAAGVPKDVALQNAKRDYLATADPLMAHPFFWAGVSLYGDPGVLKTGIVNSNMLWLYGALGMLLFAGGWIFFRRKANQ